MIINVANFNFGGDSGGGGKPALLQEKTATIVQNGSQTITPDEGFDGMSSVKINAAITGASSAIDFSQIGYSDEFSAELNAKWNNDVAYSKTLYDAWNPNNPDSTFLLYKDDKKLVYAPSIDTSNIVDNRMTGMFQGCSNLKIVPYFDTSKVTDMDRMFSSCTSLTSVPLFDTSNVTYMDSMFSGCSVLTTVPAFNTSKVTTMYSMFSSCTSLTTIPSFDTSNVTNMESMFSSCTSLTAIPEMDTSKVTNMYYFFRDCQSLTTIEGISFKSFSGTSIPYYYLVGWGSNDSIRKAVFKDIGYNSKTNLFQTSYITNWGVNTDEIPDARQSVIDSLITYSFDRATAGYPNCEITLSPNTKALLTEDEIAQITAKGFTIA